MGRIEDIAYTLVRRGNRKRLRRMLSRHAELREEHGPMLLFTAMWFNRGMLRWLLERGVPTKDRGEPTNTPLMHAAAEGDLKSLQTLIEFGADLHALNEWNENALGFACTWQQPQAIRALVAAGVDVNDQVDSGPEWTQLDVAEASGWTEVAHVLRELGGKRYAELEAVS